MNIANKVTALRLMLIPVFVIAFYAFETTNYIPVIIFIIAALTDALDGYLARSRNLITTLGKFLDPLADKLLTISALILLCSIGKVPAWILITITAREFIITGFRTLAASSGVTIAASPLGKIKTITQFAAIILLLMNNRVIVPLSVPMDKIMLNIALVFTIASLVDYICKNINVLNIMDR